MSHYKGNVRDLEFNLFEVLGRQHVLGRGSYAEIDEPTARDILALVGRLAEQEIGSSLLESDRNPPVLDPDTGEVTMPESFVRSYQAYVASEWWRLELSKGLGGTPAPPSLTWAFSELLLGANPAVKMYSSGYTFAEVLYRLGTPAQRRLARLIVDHAWGATMVLTEPDAGSDVGAGRTKAVRAPSGDWHITGVKRFITSGEAPFYDNVVHFVLARPEGAGPGTKGLSLFVVPKFQVDLQTGELGERNGVQVSNLEHKMGLKASTTCELRFGEDPDRPAVGALLGEVHDGIAQMFRLIEYARMLVGTLSTGYLNALDYARQRVQGADLTRMADKAAPRVTITHHPDVRRSLMLQKAYAEGLRALVLFTATFQDEVHSVQAQSGTDTLPEGSPAQLAQRVNDLLLPVVKGCGSERAWTLLGTESLQTFGGSGYLQDYPVEQYVRDAKIDSLYEGTTAIQGMDFFFRKIVRDDGTALAHLAEGIIELVEGGGPEDTLARERQLLGIALEDVQQMVEFMIGRLAAAGADSTPTETDSADSTPTETDSAGGDPRTIYAVGLNTTRLLLASGDLVIGWLLLRQAEVAHAALERGASGTDEPFYQGKVGAARFFARTVLPRLASDRAVVTQTDLSLMDLPEAAF
jgi:alkylation response protein AidB-like acyl-CoA dehydrogenase